MYVAGTHWNCLTEMIPVDAHKIALDFMALHCIDLFIIRIPSSLYDINKVERDVKHQIIITMHTTYVYTEK